MAMSAFERILAEMEAIMEREGIANLDEVRGCAHVG